MPFIILKSSFFIPHIVAPVVLLIGSCWGSLQPAQAQDVQATPSVEQTPSTAPVARETSLEIDDQLTQLPAPLPVEAGAPVEIITPPEPSPAPNGSTPPATIAPRPSNPPRTRVTPPSTPATVAASDGLDWEILSEPAKLPSTPVPAKAAAKSLFPSESLRAVAQRKNLALPLPNARVVIWKAARRLDLYSGSTLVKSYRVALGSNPSGHKKKQGDGRTPEGRYYICTRNATTSDFHVFLGLSYPALPDAKRAIGKKQISPREYQLIHQRLASRGAPLWETKLGGWIGIHGGTDAGFAQNKMRARGSRDWTAGCIALTNAQIEEIHAATKLGTPVDIRP